MSEIVPGKLFLGDQYDAENFSFLLQKNITAIVSCQSRFDTSVQEYRRYATSRSFSSRGESIERAGADIAAETTPPILESLQTSADGTTIKVLQILDSHYALNHMSDTIRAQLTERFFPEELSGKAMRQNPGGALSSSCTRSNAQLQLLQHTTAASEMIAPPQGKRTRNDRADRASAQSVCPGNTPACAGRANDSSAFFEVVECEDASGKVADVGDCGGTMAESGGAEMMRDCAEELEVFEDGRADDYRHHRCHDEGGGFFQSGASGSGVHVVRRFDADIDDTSREPILSHFEDIYRFVAAHTGFRPRFFFPEDPDFVVPKPSTSVGEHEHGADQGIAAPEACRVDEDHEGENDDCDEGTGVREETNTMISGSDGASFYGGINKYRIPQTCEFWGVGTHQYRMTISRKRRSSDDLVLQDMQPHGAVLLRCRSGVSRSATIAIALIMAYTEMPLHEAFMYVIQRRPICPNIGFMRQLCEAETEGSLQATCSVVEDQAVQTFLAGRMPAESAGEGPVEGVEHGWQSLQPQPFPPLRQAKGAASPGLPPSASISLTKYISWYTAHGPVRPPVPSLTP